MKPNMRQYTTASIPTTALVERRAFEPVDYTGGANLRSLIDVSVKFDLALSEAGTYPFAFPRSSSNLLLFDSNSLSSSCPVIWPWSILNASHSRINCSRSFTRAMDNSGSFEPRALARYEATKVAKAPKNGQTIQ